METGIESTFNALPSYYCLTIHCQNWNCSITYIRECCIIFFQKIILNSCIEWLFKSLIQFKNFSNGSIDLRKGAGSSIDKSYPFGDSWVSKLWIIQFTFNCEMYQTFAGEFNWLHARNYFLPTCCKPTVCWLEEILILKSHSFFSLLYEIRD